MTPCIEWPLSRSQGYAVLHTKGKRIRLHVEVWKTINGPVPEGLQLDHLCRNRACINPEHLEPVTSRVNTLRGEGPTAVNARKDVCDKGHALIPDNINMRRGRRHCRTCQQEHQRRYRETHRKELRAKALAYWHQRPLSPRPVQREPRKRRPRAATACALVCGALLYLAARSIDGW